MMVVLLAPGTIVPDGLVELDPAERHHLRVRRTAEGTEVRVQDGAGGWGEGALEGGSIRIVRTGRSARPAARVLAVGAGDRDRFGWLVEKAAECGVTELVPLMTDRAASVAGRVRSSHIPKLGQRAREAIKQSGALWAPVVHPPIGLQDCLARYPDGVRWLADPGGATPGRVDPGTPALAVIGPEGGFTPEERALLRAAGFAPVALSRQVLRFETAAIAAALLMNLPPEGEGPDG